MFDQRVVVTGTQAGKTTTLNALCAARPATERVITAEGLRTADAAPNGVDADPAAEPGGYRRDEPAPAGQGSVADASSKPSANARLISPLKPVISAARPVHRIACLSCADPLTARAVVRATTPCRADPARGEARPRNSRADLSKA